MYPISFQWKTPQLLTCSQSAKNISKSVKNLQKKKFLQSCRPRCNSKKVINLQKKYFFHRDKSNLLNTNMKGSNDEGWWHVSKKNGSDTMWECETNSDR